MEISNLWYFLKFLLTKCLWDYEERDVITSNRWSYKECTPAKIKENCDDTREIKRDTTSGKKRKVKRIKVQKK